MHELKNLEDILDLGMLTPLENEFELTLIFLNAAIATTSKRDFKDVQVDLRFLWEELYYIDDLALDAKLDNFYGDK